MGCQLSKAQMDAAGIAVYDPFYTPSVPSNGRHLIPYPVSTQFGEPNYFVPEWIPNEVNGEITSALLLCQDELDVLHYQGVPLVPNFYSFRCVEDDVIDTDEFECKRLN